MTHRTHDTTYNEAHSFREFCASLWLKMFFEVVLPRSRLLAGWTVHSAWPTRINGALADAMTSRSGGHACIVSMLTLRDHTAVRSFSSARGFAVLAGVLAPLIDSSNCGPGCGTKCGIFRRRPILRVTIFSPAPPICPSSRCAAYLDGLLSSRRVSPRISLLAVRRSIKFIDVQYSVV